VRYTQLSISIVQSLDPFLDFGIPLALPVDFVLGRGDGVSGQEDTSLLTSLEDVVMGGPL
jgi:hypothetical protein